MPLHITTGNMYIRDEDGTYHDIHILTEENKEEIIAEVTAGAVEAASEDLNELKTNVVNAASTAMEQKAQEVIGEIPSDYTELSGEVDDLKSAISASGTVLFGLQAKNTVLITNADVSEGDIATYDFDTVGDRASYITIFDTNNTVIEYIGKTSSGGSAKNFNGLYVIPSNFGKAAVSFGANGGFNLNYFSISKFIGKLKKDVETSKTDIDAFEAILDRKCVLISGQAGYNQTLFTNVEIPAGKKFYYDFTAETGRLGYLEILDATGTRIGDLIGKTSSASGDLGYSGSLTLPEGYAKVVVRTSGNAYYLTLNYVTSEEVVATMYNRAKKMEDAAGGKLKVCTYNIHRLNTTEDSSQQHEDDAIIGMRRFLSSNDFDVVGVQEGLITFPSSRTNVDDAIFKPVLPYCYNQKDSGGSDMNGVGIKSRYHLNNCNYGVFPTSGQGNYCYGTITVGGIDVLVMSVHFSSGELTTRVSQYNDLINIIGNTEYFIITGDFNAGTQSGGYGHEDEEFNILINALNCNAANGGYLGLYRYGENRALDNIFSSHNIIICNPVIYSGDIYSDHRPMIAELTVIT